MSGRIAAVVVATVCLTLGAAAGSTALTQITGAGIKNGSVTTRDMKDRSLGSGDFAASVSGEAGPVGAPGADATGAGYSFAFRTSAVVPAGSTGYSVMTSCPPGTTVLGGSGSWDTPLIVLDSRQVEGQQKWELTLAQPQGLTAVQVRPYAWCAGLTTPTFTAG